MIPDLRPAIKALARPGGVILYPTETLYGLGGRAGDDAAALRIAALKGRAAGGLIVLVSEPPPGLAPLAAALSAALWPGPVTLVVGADEVWLPGGIAPSVLGPGGTLALRCTPHPVARALIEAVGPLTSTSANLHGHPPILDPKELRGPVDAIVDVGPTPPGPPSTLIDARSGAVLREGAALSEVRSILAALGIGA